MSEIEKRAREAVAELERLAEAASAQVGSDPPEAALSVHNQPPHPPPEIVLPVRAPERPSGEDVNELWRTRNSGPPGVRRFLFGLVSRLFRAELEAQERFNGAQVRFDNSLLEWVEARFASTHRHYDVVLGQVGGHLGEIDTRHLMLQEELVKHTHDLVRRIDLVLSESEKSRMGLAQAVKSVRDRLDALEKPRGSE